MVFFLCSAVRFRSFALQPKRPQNRAARGRHLRRAPRSGPLWKQASEGERLGTLANGFENITNGARGRAASVSQNESCEVERSPGCVGPDAQSERSETEHRSRSMRARKRHAAAFRLSDRLESGVA